jgi:gas vesicle protein
MHPISFLRGALFGAFVMYLFAPRSGADTRRMLTQTGENLKNTLGDLAGNVANDVSSAAQQATSPDEAIPLPASNTYKPMTYQPQ